MGRDYYILDARQCVGNCAVWWRPQGKGYTCELNKAGLFTKEEAESHRKTDLPVHKDIAEGLVRQHVRWDSLISHGVDIYGAQRSEYV